MIDRDESRRRVRDALDRNRLDALIAASPWNVCYTAGTSFSTQRTIPERLAFTVSTAEREPAFIYCAIEEGHARDESWIEDRRGYVEFADRPVAILADVLRERGVASGRVGIEKRFLAAAYVEELAELLPDAMLVAADGIFDAMRAVKTSAEIETLGRAALETDATIAEAFAASRAGDSEADVADRMIAACRRRGGQSLLHMVLATGPNMLKAHHAPDATRLEPGGVIRTDFGMTWGHYLSDIARTAFIAPADPAAVDVYRRLEDAHQETIAAISPGVRVGDVFERCKAAFDRRGLEFRMPHIGHSIGLDLHEHPMIHPANDGQFQAGMVLMLEPIAFTADTFFHTEDMVLVTDDGPQILSRSRDWAEPLVLGRD